jgi:hypothetical protein
MDDVFTKLFNDSQKNEKANKSKSKKESDIFEKPKQAKKKPSKMDRFLKKKGMVKGTVVEQLQKKNPKNKDKPRLYVGKKDVIHQADILYMPTDNGYKYALVVAEINSLLINYSQKRRR